MSPQNPPSDDHDSGSDSGSEGSTSNGSVHESTIQQTESQNYDSILSSLESKLTDEFPRLGLKSESTKLTNLDSAEARLALITAALSSYCGGLLLEGIDPATHPVVKQLNEAKRIMGKLTEVRGSVDHIKGAEKQGGV